MTNPSVCAPMSEPDAAPPANPDSALFDLITRAVSAYWEHERLLYIHGGRQSDDPAFDASLAALKSAGLDLANLGQKVVDTPAMTLAGSWAKLELAVLIDPDGDTNPECCLDLGQPVPKIGPTHPGIQACADFILRMCPNYDPDRVRPFDPATVLPEPDQQATDD